MSLKEAGIVLGIQSTVILEAISYGKPVLTLDWLPVEFKNTIQVGAMRCKNIEEVCGLLKSWQDGDTVNKYSEEEIQNELYEFIAFSGQDSIQRINNAIENIMKKKQNCSSI